MSQLLKDINHNKLQYLGQSLKNTPVTHLNVSNNYFTHDEVLSLIQGLQGTQVTEINFGLNNIFKEYSGITNQLLNNWIISLQTALLATKINLLDFSKNDLNATGATNLIAATSQTLVTSFNFTGNCISKQNMQRLAQALTISPITTLNLKLNQICSSALRQLCAELPRSQLVTLNLSFNQELTDTSAQLLKTVLLNTKIIELNLNNTGISAIPKAQLAKLTDTQKQKIIEEIYSSTNHQPMIYHQPTYLPLSNQHQVNHLLLEQKQGTPDNSEPSVISDTLNSQKAPMLKRLPTAAYNPEKHIAFQTLFKLLPLVFQGHYALLRTYLHNFSVNTLNLSYQLTNISLNQLQHLGYALQGTAVHSIVVSNNHFSNQEMLGLLKSLYGTQITSIDFSHNDIHAIDQNKHNMNNPTPSPLIHNDSWLLGKAQYFDSIGHTQCITQHNWIANLHQALLNTQVTHLDLSGNDLGSVGAHSLLQAIQGTLVTQLNLRNNEIEAESVHVITQSLTKTQLTHLNLSHNQMNNIGLTQLVMSLKNSQLTHLDLSFNPQLNDQIAKYLINILPLTQITNLNLNGTSISPKLADNLAKILEQQHNKADLAFYATEHSLLETSPFIAQYTPLQRNANLMATQTLEVIPSPTFTKPTIG